VRYAGFWPRLAAIIVDLVVLAPLIAVGFWAVSTSRTVALLVEIPLGILFAFYNIYFVGRWGQTVGKMALKIKVVGLDGSDAGYVRGFYRHSVDLAFSIVSTTLTMLALASISPVEYDGLPFEGKMELLAERTPSWGSVVDWLSFGWVVSELVVLLLNERRRAIHDFIAGTVVVHANAEPHGSG
jgi:uncharacterized RDD family membrane protein YckC